MKPSDKTSGTTPRGGRAKRATTPAAPAPSGATSAATAASSGSRSKPPSTKPAAVHSRQTTQAKNDLAHRPAPRDAEAIALGGAAQTLGTFHELGYRQHLQARKKAEGVPNVANAARTSMSRLGSAISDPELQQQIAPSRGGPSTPSKPERTSLRVTDTHVSVTTDPSRVYAQSTVALRKKGGSSTKYAEMARKDVHPAQGNDPTHKVLSTFESQRREGRDAVSVFGKGRLLGRGELTPSDAIDPTKHGTFELRGAQATDGALDALIARNAGNTVEQYGGSSSPRGQRLHQSVKTAAEEQSRHPKKRPRLETLIEGSRTLSTVEPDIFDTPRTRPSTPELHAAFDQLFPPTPPSSPPPSPRRGVSPLSHPAFAPGSPSSPTSSPSTSQAGSRKRARLSDSDSNPLTPPTNAPAAPHPPSPTSITPPGPSRKTSATTPFPALPSTRD